MSFEYVGIVTYRDLEVATYRALQMADASPCTKSHALHDATRLEALPVSVGLLAQLSKSGFKHPKSGWSVAYGLENLVIHHVGTAVARLTRAHYRIFNTRDESLAFLREIDPTLNAISAMRSANV